MLRYVELKTNQSHQGPAWIARVHLSRSGTTVYFGAKALKRGSGASANHFDVETGEQYWVSGVKKDGSDRHWAGSGKVFIEASAVSEYLAAIGADLLDLAHLEIIPDLPAPDPSRFHHLENETLQARLHRRDGKKRSG